MFRQIRHGQFAVIVWCGRRRRITRTTQNGIGSVAIVAVAGYNDLLFECFAHIITWNSVILSTIVGIFAAQAIATNEIRGPGGIGTQINAAAETQTSEILIETVAFVQSLLFGTISTRQTKMTTSTAFPFMQNTRTKAVATIQWRRSGSTVFAE